MKLLLLLTFSLHFNLQACCLDWESFNTIGKSLEKYNRLIKTLILSKNPGVCSKGYNAINKCLQSNPILLAVELEGGQRYSSHNQELAELLYVNECIRLIKDDIAQLRLDSMSDQQKVNFIEKLPGMADEVIQVICKERLLEKMRFSHNVVFESMDLAQFSALQYFEVNQYMLAHKPLLYALNRSNRGHQHNSAAKADINTSGSHGIEEDNEDTNDIWQQPLA